MDYGQHSQNGVQSSDDALFANGLTVGVVVKPENFNPDSAESLHSDDQSISWQRNLQKRGNKIINFSDVKSDPLDNQEQLGVIELTMPPEPDKNVIEKQSKDDKKANNSYDYKNFRIVGDKASAAVIKKAEEIENEKIKKNDDAEGYVDAIRDDCYGASVTILENSFGDKSEWRKAA